MTSLRNMFYDEHDNATPHAKEIVAGLLEPEEGEESEDGEASVQLTTNFQMRIGDRQKHTWKRAADVEGVPVSRWLRQLADERARELLECSHPMSARLAYPWSETCQACGVRLKG